MKKIIFIFVCWLVLLFLFSFIASKIFAFTYHFPYIDTVLQFTKLPEWVWAFGNFDGVHYLRIAQNGYQDQYYQAFFPLYPLLIRLFNIFPKDPAVNTLVNVDRSYFYTGIILSNLFLIVSLLLLKWENSKNNSYLIKVGAILLFPTAFYFASIYSESLFLTLLICFMLLVKKKRYFLAGIVSALATATRVIGITFPLILLIKIIMDFKKERFDIYKLFGFIVSPMGILGFMYYLFYKFGDPLAFLSSQPGFGAGRSSIPIITLPQVFFRYFRMFQTVTDSTQLFTICSEFIFSVTILALIIWAYKKVEFHWWLMALLMYLIPTLTGTFSSMPRYVIFPYVILVPALFPYIKKYKKVFAVLFLFLLMIYTILFTRGYWVA